MELESDLLKQLEVRGVIASEHLGQHFLVDEDVLDMVVEVISSGIEVLEIGSGPGNLTERLANRANRVLGIELDRKFQPILDDLESSHENVDIIYGDAMTIDYKSLMEKEDGAWQIVSNLPFHISEPFLAKIANLPIEQAVLVVGDNLARKMEINRPDDLSFSKTSLLTQTFFEPNILAKIDSKSFHPSPRTDAALVSLYPRGKQDYERNLGLAILRNLFISQKAGSSVEKVIKESFFAGERRSALSKRENHRFSRRKSRQQMRQITQDWQHGGVGSFDEDVSLSGGNDVDRLGIPQDILSKPFSRLDNHDLRVLTNALNSRFGQVS